MATNGKVKSYAWLSLSSISTSGFTRSVSFASEMKLAMSIDQRINVMVNMTRMAATVNSDTLERRRDLRLMKHVSKKAAFKR